MIRIKSCRMVGWNQHIDRTEKFVPGTNGIVGPNGSGKSNLLGAIYTSFTGQIQLGNIEDNINYDADEAMVETVFEQDGTEGKVTRKFKAKRGEDGRDKATSTASLVFGEDKTTGTRKVTTAMEALVGMPPRLLNEHVFVGQEKLTALLFQTHAERMKNFVGLIPGLERAEPIRNDCHQELIRFPEIEMGVSLDSVTANVKLVQGETLELTKTDTFVEHQLKALDIQASLDVLREYDKGANVTAFISTLKAQLQEIAPRLDTMVVNQAGTDEELAGALNDVEDNKAAYDTAKNLLASATSNQAIELERARALSKKREAEEGLKDEVPPQDPEGWSNVVFDDMKSKLAKAEANKVEFDKTAKLLGSGEIECPIGFGKCNNVPADPEAEAQKARDASAKLDEPIKVLSTELARLRGLCTRQEKLVSDGLLRRSIFAAQLQTAEDTLSKLPDVIVPTEALLEASRTTVDRYELDTQRKNELQTKSAQLASGYEALTASKAEKQQQLETHLEAEKAIPSIEQMNNALSQKDEFERLQTQQAETRGSLNAKNDELQRLEVQAEQIKEAMDKADNVMAYRQLLLDERELLHRDQLPAEVLSSYIGRFDDLCNKFLGLFGSPFAIMVDKDMDITCTMPNGHVLMSERLSGGQRAVLSVAARFAIHELFAKDLNLLVLDEPSQNMDDDNVKWLSELLAQVSTVSRSSNAQTIVVTHHTVEMRGSFDNVIDLTPEV